MKFQRIITLMLAAILLTALFTSCGKKTEELIDEEIISSDVGITDSEAGNTGNSAVTTPGKGTGSQTTSSQSGGNSVSSLKSKWYIGKDKTLSWYINYNSWQYNNSWTSYPVLKEVTEITGVTPKIIVSTGDGQLKLQTMIASNSLPDLISLGPDDPIGTKMISQEYVVSYDSLIKKYAPDFKTEIDADIWRDLAADNGQLYGLPCFYVKNVKDLGATTFNVRSDIWNELGQPDMSTPAGYKNALIAYKNKYPKVNGVNSIPMTLGNSYYRFIFEESFGIKTYYVDSQNNVKIRFSNPDYKKVVEYLNDLYTSGLMDPEVFTKQDGGLKQDLAAGRVFSYPCTFWDLDSSNAALNQKKDGSGFVAVKPMIAAENVSFPGQNKRGWMVTMISKKCKDPETAIKFTRFMWSKDGNLLVNYGHEGTDYTINGDTISRSKANALAMQTDPDKFATKTGIFTFRLFSYPYYREVPALVDNVRLSNEKIAGDYVRDNSVFTYKMDPDPATPIGKIATQVWNIYDAKWPLIIMAGSKTEALSQLDSMLSDMEKQGLSKLEEYWTGQYKANVTRFGAVQ